MGMAIDGEGCAAVATPPPPAAAPAIAPSSPPSFRSIAAAPAASAAPAADVVGTHGEGETSEQKVRRERSNSEETALILTSMMSMAGAATTKKHDTDDSDMGEDDLSDQDDDMDVDASPANSTGKSKRRVQHVHFGGPTGSKLDFTDDAGLNHRFRNESNRVKSLVTKHISIDELREHFDRPIIDVAKDFGICITLMKKICRRNGIKRWPHRQIRSLSKSIASMEAAMLSSQGPERDKYRDQILSLKLKRDSVIADPNKENSMAARPKTPTKDSTSTRPHAHVHATPKLSPRSGGSTPATTPGGKENSKGGRWTSEEHAAFLHGIRLYGKDWRRVAHVVRTRSAVQTRTHAQKYLLKFAGRFPFDTDGLELKQEPGAAVATQPQQEPTETQDNSGPRQREDEAVAETPTTEKETDGGDTASMSSSSIEDETASVSPSLPRPAAAAVSLPLTVDTAVAKQSALETMAMILNSPQFNSSFRQMAPPPIQTQQLMLPPRSETAKDGGDGDGDVTMESPRGAASGGVPATLPLLPSFVIKPGVWPSQAAQAETSKSESDVPSKEAP
jgi:SHAQKYF class myb-like DNA-binding protein